MRLTSPGLAILLMVLWVVTIILGILDVLNGWETLLICLLDIPAVGIIWGLSTMIWDLVTRPHQSKK